MIAVDVAESIWVSWVSLRFTSVISALGTSNNWMGAMHLINEMEATDVAMNLITWTLGTWNAKCVNMSRLPPVFALQIFATMFKCMPLRNSFINALSQGSQWQKTLAALFNVPSSCYPADATSFQAAIRAADAISNWRLALALLAEMPKRRLEFCLVCCSSTMRACREEWQARRSKWSKCIKMYSFPSKKSPHHNPFNHPNILNVQSIWSGGDFGIAGLDFFPATCSRRNCLHGSHHCMWPVKPLASRIGFLVWYLLCTFERIGIQNKSKLSQSNDLWFGFLRKSVRTFLKKLWMRSPTVLWSRHCPLVVYGSWCPISWSRSNSPASTAFLSRNMITCYKQAALWIVSSTQCWWCSFKSLAQMRSRCFWSIPMLVEACMSSLEACKQMSIISFGGSLR